MKASNSDSRTDIFISYRREGGLDTARTIYLALRGAGYENIFFDFDSLRTGDYKAKIENAVSECKDYILLLSEGSLDRCVDEDDFVRLEMATALKSNCNIIPVTINKKEVTFPAGFPEDLKAFTKIQYSDIKTDEFFADSIRHICDRLVTAPKPTLSRDLNGAKERKTFKELLSEKHIMVTAAEVFQTFAFAVILLSLANLFIAPGYISRHFMSVSFDLNALLCGMLALSVVFTVCLFMDLKWAFYAISALDFIELALLILLCIEIYRRYQAHHFDLNGIYRNLKVDGQSLLAKGGKSLNWIMIFETYILIPVHIAIMWAVLRLPKNGKSAWELLQ